ncbi:MAG: hypothetical protein K0U38_09470 [Epsilonproteobacteria bacterium]|nr:hypothetical protein [Campylobacterota bacterium]
MRYLVYVTTLLSVTLFFSGCISANNETVEGGTPDVTQCSPIDGVLDGADFVPKDAIAAHEDDGRTHPDLFYIAWAQLDSRIDLRFPERGYDDTGFEDKLLVSRKQRDGSYKTWQIYPSLDNECKDVEKVRIQSFDVAPDGKSLYLAMSKPVFSESDTLKETDLNPDRNLGIFKLEIASKKITPITHDYSISYSYPTYIGNDEDSDHEMLLISKTVTKNDIPMNYKQNVMLDEYDRHPAPLIHKLDTVTGTVTRIGFNNSHQTEPVVINQGEDTPLVVFTEWEHQATVNRFSLWKMQIDGSDTFMFYGDEANTKDTDENVYQARQVKSGPYKDYILMGQAGRTGNDSTFLGEGDILMTKRVHLDLRSPKIFLSKAETSSGVERDIARTPEHYNDESFVYAYREDTDSSYKIYIKDYPEDVNDTMDTSAGTEVIASNDYHFMQPRSFYPPVSKKVAPGVNDLSENRVSFTNNKLNGKGGFLVENLLNSNNGEQHQLNGISADEIRMQFYVPSHHFSDSYTIGTEQSPEMTIPSSNFIAPESDGSMGVIMKEGLYVWKVHKKFPFTDGDGYSSNIWVPVRAERQEVSFVPNRVNECNQCHQDRNQGILDKYNGYYSLAHYKMRGDLSDVVGDNDISDYNATEEIPDFHAKIAPLFTKPALDGGGSCVSCHDVKDKLNLSNMTGVNIKNYTYRNFVLGAHKMEDNSTLPYQYNAINPMGMDETYHPAPFLWSLILNDDLSVPEEDGYPNSASRDLNRSGDYGATYSTDVADEISRINTIYDHSKHWSYGDVQDIITYGSTQIPVALSDRHSFVTNSLATNTPQAQKAYQALVKNCYSCHNNHNSGGLRDVNFQDIIPKEKRFNDPYYLRDSVMRFSIYRHLANKGDTKYSQYLWQSNLDNSMSKTLSSALYRIDFNDLNNSELLAYARGYDKNGVDLNDNIKAHKGYLTEGSSDYKAIENWINGVAMTNATPVIDVPTKVITIKEYDDPAYLEQNITWSDADTLADGSQELSQAFITGSDDREIVTKTTDSGGTVSFVNNESTSEHTFNDTMLSMEYNNFVSARLKMYAILGDRGNQNLAFTVSDGLGGGTQNIEVNITSDYIVPKPIETLPTSYLFFTDRNTSMLKRLETNETNESIQKVTDIGVITGFDKGWTTMYRRADKGWLYFVNQEEQRIYVVDETNADVLFNIDIDHEPNRVGTSHKQTLYLIWWRPAEGVEGEDGYRAGQLEGLLESKLSSEADHNGDFYVGLGDGEDPSGVDVVPEWRTKMPDGGNTIGVYVWKRATFMTKWVNDGIDRMNVLNLETGKTKYMTDFNFTAQSVDTVDYNASAYWNVRAIVVAEDGAFYGFNKDLNVEPEVFNFDPMLGIQKKVDVPAWIQEYINDYNNYATPFLVIEPRNTP